MIISDGIFCCDTNKMELKRLLCVDRCRYTQPEANIFNYKIARAYTRLQLIEDGQNTSCKMIQNTLHEGNT